MMTIHQDIQAFLQRLIAADRDRDAVKIIETIREFERRSYPKAGDSEKANIALENALIDQGGSLAAFAKARRRGREREQNERLATATEKTATPATSVRRKPATSKPAAKRKR